MAGAGCRVLGGGSVPEPGVGAMAGACGTHLAGRGCPQPGGGLAGRGLEGR
jgi:hypothetical protein